MARIFTLLLTCAAVLTLAAACGGGSAAVVPLRPTISSIEPASGGTAGGTPLTIRGSNLANKQPGTYEIWIGGQAALEINVVDSTEVECKTPSGATGPVDVEIVTIEGVGMAASGFMYYPPPTLDNLDPDAGSRDGGLFTTVTGTGFTANNPGDTICMIGGKPLTNQVVVDDTTLTGYSPTSWTEVAKDVVVVNRNGMDTLSGGWLYFGPIPSMISISPNDGLRGGGYTVTITGEDFTEAGGLLDVKFNGIPATDVTRIDDGELTCTVPSSTISGWVDVSVGNSNGVSTRSDFFYYIPAPAIAFLDPDEGSIAGGDTVDVIGSEFQATGAGTTTITFDGNDATNINIQSNTLIKCDVPAGAVGPVDVVITNDLGSFTLGNGYTYTLPSFWWEETWGTQSGLTADTGIYAVSIPNGFPYFGTTWNSVNAISDHHLDFGATFTSYSQCHTLFTFPHISVVANDGYVRPATDMWGTSHVSDRTIITYDNVPEYSTLGANSYQVHLTDSGVFAIVFQTMTSHQGNFNPWGTLAVNPGSGTDVQVDFTTGSHVGGATDALNEHFTSVTDLQDGVLMFLPNSSGGYTSIWLPGVPPDPHP